jgi:arylsulfatase A-like enzyme
MTVPKPTLLLLALLLGAAAPAALAGERPPNFVILFIDDLGYGDIGPFGSTLNRTPNLDRMAREGMKLTSFYAAPLCSASRAQLLTGCYAKRISMPNVLPPVSATGLGPREHTLAELLKRRGYATACFGKWHVGDQPPFLPTRRGFDRYLGLPYSNDMGGTGRPNDRRPPLPLLRDARVVEVVTSEGQDRLTERYTDEAVAFIRANKDRPFFLYLPHTAVHVPIHPGARFKGKSRNGRFGDWVEEVDWSSGRVLDTLRELKLGASTLVVFTSDNGPWLQQGKDAGSAGPLRNGKGSTWEGGLREPTLAWWPGKIAPGSRCDAVAATFDLLPTFVKLAGGQVPGDRRIDGRDIWPLLSGSSGESPHEAFYYFLGPTLEAVRSGPWKLRLPGASDGVFARKKSHPDPAAARPRLYNLDTDIGEMTDMAGQHAEVVQRLLGLADRMDADLGKSQPGPGVRPAGKVEAPKPLLLKSSQAEALRPRTLADILRTLENPQWR